ncbi:aliphatic sulfonate ABC transporter substrate-binding protein [Bacillus fonticola]|uniref:aliphatic sulfonate ABC transporter substrate-binding protein n=1 Tax=Bacillus fonticola TaxID=2728853 RepID=UPI001476387B|nr:aliphatic sulfonate ABC transporter substrate-binding protein [Bacillus fonticola]
MMKRFGLGIGFILLLITLAGCSGEASGDGKPDKITMDYAYYSPTSLVLKEKGYLEDALADEGIEVEWVLSQGSNKALEFLNSNSVDFGSTAGAAALMAKAQGAPISSVYLYSKPEWTALVTTEDSEISSVEDLKGAKVAATLGTDPYIFLLQALQEAGLSASDVEIVNLQHSDGAQALLNDQVDAWAGLDPHMARVELDSNGKLFYRNTEFNTYGTLNVADEFKEAYPDYVDVVLAAYEQARTWTLENPEEAASILAESADLSVEVANKSMERNDFSNIVPNDDVRQALLAAGDVLQAQEVIPADVNVGETVDELLDPSFTEDIVGQ